MTILLVSLSMGMTFCHALEFLPKVGYTSSLYLTVQRTLYLLFGVPLGASIEVGALTASVALIFLVRKRRPAFAITLVAAVCMIAAHAIWWIWVNPANSAIARMIMQNPPADWKEWRLQWEYAHLVRFGLQLIAFASLLSSVILETPGRPR